MQSLPSFSTIIETHLEILAKNIASVPKQPEAKEEVGYLEAIRTIYEITQPCFNRIAELAEKMGFSKVEAFEAWPKGLCENFIFGVADPSGKVTNVILAKNKKYQFLQNGGGKTGSKESSEQAAFKEAQEEFSFKGTEKQIKKITIESESGLPSFHFVKGVNLILITPEEAAQLKLADDMVSNEIATMPVEKFLGVTKADVKPIDHGFDRKWIGQYIEALNNGKAIGENQFYQRQVTEEDQIMAARAFEWMKNIRVNSHDLHHLQNLIQSAMTSFPEKGAAHGPWKSENNREVVKKAAQKVVDAIVKKLLPDWTYVGKKGEEKACQIKVQEAVGVLVNDDPLPSFLTIPQMVALQSKLSKGHQIEIVSLSQDGEFRNIITKQ